MNGPGTQVQHLDGIRILDLFAGPGGLDVAAHFLGYKSIGIEWDRNACETRYAAGLPTIHADVSVMRESRFDEIPESVDVLAGGPPCQSFSVAGKGAGLHALARVKDFIHRLVHGDDESRIDEELHALGDPPHGARPRTSPLAPQGDRDRWRDPYKVFGENPLPE